MQNWILRWLFGGILEIQAFLMLQNRILEALGAGAPSGRVPVESKAWNQSFIPIDSWNCLFMQTSNETLSTSTGKSLRAFQGEIKNSKDSRPWHGNQYCSVSHSLHLYSRSLQVSNSYKSGQSRHSQIKNLKMRSFLTLFVNFSTIGFVLSTKDFSRHHNNGYSNYVADDTVKISVSFYDFNTPSQEQFLPGILNYLYF